MKLTFTFLLVAITLTSQAQHSLERIWETDSTLAIPESVLFDNTLLYVTLIDGAPWDADGKGGVAKVDKKGKITNATWVTGLNAPKGMGLWNKMLYVADLSDVVVINTVNGKVESRISIAGATGLNDITVDNKGTVYVSDFLQGNVHRIRNGKAEPWLSGLKDINGLKAVGNDLYLLAGSAGVLKAGPDKKTTLVSPMELGGDGIEPVGGGEYVVTCWPGVIYYLSKDGKMQTLLDTRAQKIYSADIGYNSPERIVYVPTFFGKSVVAYRLK